jgi:hypothetical protein
MSFADELAASAARGSSFVTFAALAVAAVVMIVSQLTLGRLSHYPGYSNGLSMLLFLPAILGMLVAPQIALVAGTLAAWRALRRRRVAVAAYDESEQRRRAGLRRRSRGRRLRPASPRARVVRAPSVQA